VSRPISAAFALLAVVALAGCAEQAPDTQVDAAPGFLLGLFHGFILLFAFVLSLFTDVAVYAVPNAGWSYDLGFLIGAMMFFGGGGGGAARYR